MLKSHGPHEYVGPIVGTPLSIVSTHVDQTQRKFFTKIQARAHKGEYHDSAFVDAAGNRWLLYYFLDGDGADNAGHVRSSGASKEGNTEK